MSEAKFTIITPARNEAAYLGKTIKSVISQTLLPQEWVIVDDGSTDETPRIAQAAAQVHPWIKVVRRRDRGYRDVGRGQAEAIREGLQHISADDYEFLFNLDADIIIGSDYFKVILHKFAENSKLGIACGQLYEYFNGRLTKMRVLPLGMIGAVQGWRKECFQEIGGLAKGPGWDGIASFKAMMLGWQTKTFEDDELTVIHLRPEGSSIRSKYHGWARHGQALHFAGAHPLWVLASAGYHMLDRPFVLGGLCLIIGYLEALFQGAARYEDRQFQRYLRKWQLEKLSQILRLR